MSLPFTRTVFFEVFAAYNRAFPAAPFVLGALAVGCVAAALVGRGRGKSIGYALAAGWAWCAIAYHALFFTAINRAAWIFAAAFLFASFELALHARKGSLRFERFSLAGLVLVAYAVVGYPIIGWLAGERWPHAPTFGLPCPLTIFTLGMLLFARRPVPAGVFVVPMSWTLIGGYAATDLGVVQDYGLVAAGGLTAVVLVGRVLCERQRAPSRMKYHRA